MMFGWAARATPQSAQGIDMGLLDQVLGQVLGQGGQRQGGSGGLGDLLSGLAGGGRPSGGAGGNLLATLLPVALAMLANRGSAGGSGGLGGLLDKFRAAGLAQQADSWVSTGENLPLSPDQLTNVLGHDRLAQIASQAGLSETQATDGLASILPDLVNHLTPQGQVPQQSDVDDALGGLRRSLGL